MKNILIGLTIVVVVILGAGVLLFSNLDKIIETGIETAGTRVIGSRVEVGRVELDLAAGSAEIHEFSIANPSGFSNAEMISFDELSLSINLQDTSGERVHINSVVARSPFVLYESTDGVSNLDAVNARFESGETVDTESAEETQVMLVIDSILIEDINGTLLSGNLPGPIDVELGDISLSNLEGYPDELARQIMGPVINQMGAAAAQALLQATAQLLSETADAVSEQLEDAEDALGDVEDALESVGNLFKRD